jgi:hypothetical protein
LLDRPETIYDRLHLQHPDPTPSSKQDLYTFFSL